MHHTIKKCTFTLSIWKVRCLSINRNRTAVGSWWRSVACCFWTPYHAICRTMISVLFWCWNSEIHNSRFQGHKARGRKKPWLLSVQKYKCPAQLVKSHQSLIWIFVKTLFLNVDILQGKYWHLGSLSRHAQNTFRKRKTEVRTREHWHYASLYSVFLLGMRSHSHPLSTHVTKKQ